ncbi:MAG: hypothetical protein Q7T55_15485, partial [Solirubrobacteraceae bacterium]|nr:hypothetical protein [Solirubrobacteraceae bacterium]
MTSSLLTPPSSAARVAGAAADRSGAAMNDELAERLAARAKVAKKKAAAKKVTKKRTTRKKAKKLPVCTAKDLKTKKSKRRKCRLVKKKVIAGKAPVSSPTGPVAAPPVTAPTPDAWTPLPTVTDSRTDGLPVYSGTFGVVEATRLLFRGGFGPLPGQAEEFAALGVKGAVARLMNPTAGRGSAAA